MVYNLVVVCCTIAHFHKERKGVEIDIVFSFSGEHVQRVKDFDIFAPKELQPLVP